MAKKLTSPQSGRAHATRRVRKADRNLASGVRESLTSNLIERSTAAPHQMQPTDVLQLQRLVGNQVVSRMLVQPQLEVGPAGDGYEKEADRIAEQVVRSQSAPPARQKDSQSVQRVPVIQRLPRNSPVGAKGGRLNAKLESDLRSSQNGGSSLPDTIRRKLEPRLGANLSGVKIHTGSKAAQLSRDMGAKAFTHKNHIYYGAGQSPSNLKLTAHEAVHTIQQGAVVQRKPQKKFPSGRGIIQRAYQPKGKEDPLNDYAEGDMSLFYGMEAPGDYRNLTLSRRNDSQMKNKYPTIDSINRDVGINAEMSKGTSATGIFKVRQALADPKNWDSYLPAVSGWRKIPQLKKWVATLVAHADSIGLYDFSDSKKTGIWKWRQPKGKKKLGRRSRFTKNIAPNMRKYASVNMIYEWLSMPAATGVQYDGQKLPNGVDMYNYVGISEWIYRAFFRRTSKLGLHFATNVLNAKVYFNTSGSVGYSGSWGSGTKQKGGIKTASDRDNQSNQRAITISEYRHLKRMLRKWKISRSKVHFYDEFS